MASNPVTPIRMSLELRERIAAVLRPDEKRAGFVREATLKEIERREKSKRRKAA